jgi:putative hydrolase of the HAD superfamily
MKYKAVLFDLFGTLVDNFSRASYESVLADMALVVGVPREDFVRLWFETYQERNTGIHPTPQFSLRFICMELDIDVTEEQIQRAAHIRLDYSRSALEPRADTIDTIKQLKAANIKTALISDCTGDIPMVWESTKFAGILDATVFSCEVNAKKPDPAIYRAATERLGVNPGECLFVGDGGSEELSGARQLGMTAVLIRDPDEGDYQMMTREDDWDGPRIKYLREVLDLVK